jgi:hypothetical protein
MDTNQTTTPIFQNIIRLFTKDTLSFMLTNDKVVVGKIETYDQTFVVVRVEEKRRFSQTSADTTVVIPFTSIQTIKPLSVDTLE